MDKLRAIIIDDEEDAVKSILLIIEEFCTDIKIVGTSTSAYEGEVLIEEKKPDVVFLEGESMCNTSLPPTKRIWSI